jgi:hypothetical protein
MEQLDVHKQAEVAYTVAADTLQALMVTGQLFDQLHSLSQEDRQGVQDWMTIIINYHRREAQKSAELSRREQERIARHTFSLPDK